MHKKMEKGDDLNSYVFNLFVYDLDNGVFEFFTDWKFFGIDVKEAVSNAEQWIEKSFPNFDSLEWVIERTDVKRQTHFFINSIPIDKYISAYNNVKNK